MTDVVRLLFVCKSLPYSFKGGIQTHVWELTQYLMREGCQVTILTGGSLRRGLRTEYHEGREIVFLPYVPGRKFPFLHKTIEDVSFNVMAYRWLRSHARGFDCVHVQGRSGCFYAAGAGRTSPPVLTTFHRLLAVEYAYDGQATGKIDGLLHRFIMGVAEGRAARHTDHAIAVSREMRKELVEYFPERLAPMTILPNGVSAAFGEPVASPDPWQLVFVGRLEKIKGVYSLLEAMALTDERIQLKMIGEGPERRGLERIIQRTPGLRARVQLLGDQDADAVRHYIQRATALVLPSYHESQGIVLIEAGICGRPVIGASAPGIDEVVLHGETGLLYPPGDHRSLALLIDHLYAQPVLAKALGAAGRRRALTVYNWESIARETMGLYASLIDKNAADADPTRAVARPITATQALPV